MRQTRWEEALGLAVSFMPLRSLVQLATASKSASSLVSAYLRAGEAMPAATALLLAAVRDDAIKAGAAAAAQWTGRAERADQQTTVKLIQWLLCTAGGQLLQRNRLAMLHTPFIPLPLAAALLAAGMRFSYTELLDAAKQGVAGVDCWVQAASAQDCLPPGMPAAAVSMCSTEMIARGLWSELSAPHFNSEEAIQALFLAAVSLRGRLQIDMNDSLPWLHCCLALCRATHHTVDTPTLIHLLQVASKAGADFAVFTFVKYLPAASLLSQEQLAGLLQLIIASSKVQSRSECGVQLCFWMQQTGRGFFDSGVLLSLLLQTMDVAVLQTSCFWYCLLALAGYSAPDDEEQQQQEQQHQNYPLLVADAVQLLHAALAPSRTPKTIEALCHLPAAAAIEPNAVSGVIAACISNISQQGSLEKLTLLCKLKCVQQLTGPEPISQWMQLAAQQSSCGAILQLLTLPAARDADAVAVAAALAAALAGTGAEASSAFPALCGLPAAMQLSIDQASDLLGTALASCESPPGFREASAASAGGEVGHEYDDGYDDDGELQHHLKLAALRKLMAAAARRTAAAAMR